MYTYVDIIGRYKSQRQVNVLIILQTTGVCFVVFFKKYITIIISKPSIRFIAV